MNKTTAIYNFPASEHPILRLEGAISATSATPTSHPVSAQFPFSNGR